jgi:O-antigen/teichoic acid export membrane protein
MVSKAFHPIPITSAVHRALDAVKNNGWGFLDQALISGTNFLFMILLARHLGPAAFGDFVVAYTVLIFANSIQAPLFTLPHNVLGATRMGPDYAHYTTTTALAQTAFSLGIGLLIALVGGAALAAGHPGAGLILALAPTCVAWQLQEFICRVMYTHSDYKDALLINLVAYGGQLAGIAVLFLFQRLDAMSAVLMIGVTSGIAGVLAGWRVRSLFTRRLARATVREELKENWMFGRWLLGSSLTAWVSGQLYPLLTAGIVGVGAAGGMRAAQTLMGPTHVLLKGMDAIFPSRAARVHDTEGITGLLAYIRKIAVPGGAILVLYCGFVAIAAEPLSVLLLGQAYEPFAWLVRVSAASYLLVYLSSVASIALRSAKATAPVFRAYIYSSILVLTLGITMVRLMGLQGAVIGVALHSLVMNIVLWKHLSTISRTEHHGDGTDRQGTIMLAPFSSSQRLHWNRRRI